MKLLVYGLFELFFVATGLGCVVTRLGCVVTGLCSVMTGFCFVLTWLLSESTVLSSVVTGL